MRFDYKPEEIISLSEKMIKENMKKIDDIVNIKGERTFQNTVAAYAKMEHEYGSAASHILFLKNVSPSAEVRSAIGKASKLFSDADLLIENRADFYQAFKEYREHSEKNGEWKTLTQEDQRFVNRVIQEYELSGLDLPADKKKQLNQLKTEISELEKKAEENIAEEKTKIEVEEKKLEGLDQSFIQRLEKV